MSAHALGGEAAGVLFLVADAMYAGLAPLPCHGVKPCVEFSPQTNTVFVPVAVSSNAAVVKAGTSTCMLFAHCALSHTRAIPDRALLEAIILCGIVVAFGQRPVAAQLLLYNQSTCPVCVLQLAAFECPMMPHQIAQLNRYHGPVIAKYKTTQRHFDRMMQHLSEALLAHGAQVSMPACMLLSFSYTAGHPAEPSENAAKAFNCGPLAFLNAASTFIHSWALSSTMAEAGGHRTSTDRIS